MFEFKSITISSLRVLGRHTPINIFLFSVKSDNIISLLKILLLNKLKFFTREPYYKHTLDYVIVDTLDSRYPSYLRYRELEKEVSLYHKVPSATLSFHLWDMRFRHVLDKKEEKNGYTFYSLTNEFKDQLDAQKKQHPTDYVKETLSLPEFRRQWSILVEPLEPLEGLRPVDEG